MNMSKRVVRVVLPLLVLTIGAFIAVTILQESPAPARAAEAEQIETVEVIPLRVASAQATLSATGLVQPARQVIVMPEVSGRIVARGEEMLPGGRLQEGDLIVRLDGRQHRYQLRQESARVRSAQLEVQTEESRRSIAEREWELLGDGRPREEASLALRGPHLDTARANLDSARSRVDIARLNLSHTTLRAPFDAVVLEADAEVGQLVSPSSRVATLVATDQLWVRVSLPIARLDELNIPGVNAEEGSPARVIHVLGRGREVVREGRVLRLEGQLDAETRTGRLLIVVDDPLDRPVGAIPLLPGAFVRVELEGEVIEGAFEVPRAAIRQGHELWIASVDDQLEQRTVEVLWGDDEVAYIRGDDLSPGLRVVISPLASPLVGTPLRVMTASSDDGGASS